MMRYIHYMQTANKLMELFEGSQPSVEFFVKRFIDIDDLVEDGESAFVSRYCTENNYFIYTPNTPSHVELVMPG